MHPVAYIHNTDVREFGPPVLAPAPVAQSTAWAGPSPVSGTRSQAGDAVDEQWGEEPAECDVDPKVEPDECSEGLAGIRKPEAPRMEVYKEASHPWTPTTSSLSAPLNPPPHPSSTTEGDTLLNKLLKVVPNPGHAR
jgi:hypothetical protein